MKKKKYGWLKHLDFMLIDLLCIQIAYLVAWVMRHHSIHIYQDFSLYGHVNVILIVLDLCYVLMRMTYKNILKRGVFVEIESVLVHNAVVWGLTMAYLYVTKQAFFFSRAVFLTAFLCSIVFMLFGRIGWKMLIRKRLGKGKHLSYILVVTTKDYATRMVSRFNSRMYNGFNLKGFAIVDEDMVGQKIGRFPVLCNKDTLVEFVLPRVVDEVMINLPYQNEQVSDWIHRLLQMGIVVHIGLDYVDDELPNRTIERIGGFTFLTTRIQTMSPAAHVVKRGIDIVAGLIGSAATLLLMLALGPLIYRTDPGPIIYRQERVGKNGRRFTIYKFRSMYQDADERRAELMKQNEMSGQIFKMKDDPRILKKETGLVKNVGDYIRRTSLDEFPQFFNILRGDMSLVGTRPPMVDEFENYDVHHRARLSMTPGLTGLWQVSGRNQITDFEEIVRLDTEYIENWSLKLDLEIILKTVKVVIQRRGAQ